MHGEPKCGKLFAEVDNHHTIFVNREVTKALLLMLIFLVTGCKRNSDNQNRYLFRDVNNSDLIGTWEITEPTLKQLKKEGYKKYINKNDHQLILNNDSTCEISTFSSLLFHPTTQEETEYYLNKERGTWKIISENSFKEEKSFYVVEINIENESKKDKTIIINSISIRFTIAEINKKLILWGYVGDPDYREYYEFIKGKLEEK